MADMIFILVLNVLMILLDICAVIGSGLILFIVFSDKTLRRNEHLYLIITLACIDFTLAVTFIPYLVSILSGWGKQPSMMRKLPNLQSINTYATMLAVCHLIRNFLLYLTLLHGIQKER